MGKGRLDEAIAEYRAAIATRRDDPEAYIAHYLLGNALMGKGQDDEAIAEYREAIRLKKDNAELHNHLGLALAKNSRMDESGDNAGVEGGIVQESEASRQSDHR
jgi:Flp pilus assembly protein TadD